MGLPELTGIAYIVLGVFLDQYTTRKGLKEVFRQTRSFEKALKFENIWIPRQIYRLFGFDIGPLIYGFVEFVVIFVLLRFADSILISAYGTIGQESWFFVSGILVGVAIHNYIMYKNLKKNPMKK